MNTRSSTPGRAARIAAAAVAASLVAVLAGCSTSTGGSTAGKHTYNIAFANATADGGTYQGLESTLKQALSGVSSSALENRLARAAKAQGAGGEVPLTADEVVDEKVETEVG